MTVRLGTSRQDETDSQGKFFFTGVQEGEQTLEVCDKQGALLASAPLKLDFSMEKEASAEITVSGGAEFRLPENTRMLDVTFTVEEDTLTIREGASYLVTTNGEIVDFTGGKLAVKKDTFAVTPTGNVVASGGFVLLPSQETVLTPPGGSQTVGAESRPVPGLEVQPDGSAKTEAGVIILPDSGVKPPDGGSVKSEDKVIVVDGDQAEEVEQLPRPGEDAGGEKDTDEPFRDPSSPKPAPSVPGAESSAPAEGENDAELSAPGPGSSGEPEPSVEPEPTVTPEPTPRGIAVEDLTTGAEWKQQSMIDLFKSRDSNPELGMEGGIPVIAPGSSGHYNFRLKNNNDFDIVYTIEIQEQSFHLPIGYSVVDAQTNYYYMSMARTGEDTGLATSTITLEANSQREYRIEWEWELEDRYRREETNAKDTLAATGSLEERTYVLSVGINAAQVLPEEPEIPDGENTKYPGKR